MSKQINDIAYEVAKEEFGDKLFSFNQLWSKTVGRIKTPTKEQAAVKGELYSEIMQDTNFLYIGKQNWKLREFVDQNTLKKTLASSLYDFDKSLTEEDIEDMDVLSERFDEESGMYYDETEDEAIQSLQGMAEISKDEEENE